MATVSAERVVPGSCNPPPAPWPKTALTPADAIDAPAVAAQLIASLNDALARRDFAAAADVFLPDSTAKDAAAPFWRDHLVLSWRLRTLKGRDRIRSFLASESCLSGGGNNGDEANAGLKLQVDDSSAFRKPQVMGLRPAGDVTGVHFFVTVESGVGVGRGIVRAAEVEKGLWKIWTLFTTLEQVKGAEERTGARRERGVLHGGVEGRRNWAERRRDESAFVGADPDVLIIGMSCSVFLPGSAGYSIELGLRVPLLTCWIRGRTSWLDCRGTIEDAGRPGPRDRQDPGCWR